MITEILRPATVQEALKARAMPGTAFLGGGTWLNAAPSDAPLILISLEKLGLGKIEASQARCVIGASVTFQQLVDHDGCPPAVRRAAALTGSRTLRNMITVGGEIALHPLDSALVPVLLAMEAEVSIAGKKRPLALDAWLRDGGSGLVLSIVVRDPSRPAAVRAVSRTAHSGRSLVIAACAGAVTPPVKGLRLVASDCRGTAVRLLAAEQALEGKALPPRVEIEERTAGAFAPQPDMHASSAYKQYMTRILVADALEEMAGKAGGA
ncbi:MAG TPA: FAD binding domain-containing protein [Spirochaetia bacterium]|nr:FAD binding domain-containing protein [Spirochaetia bacterium]